MSDKYLSGIDSLGEILVPINNALEEDVVIDGFICSNEDVPPFVQVGESLAKEAAEFVKLGVELSAKITQRLCAIGIAALDNAQIEKPDKD